MCWTLAQAMDPKIREAAYLFEFEGKSRLAIETLESVVRTGNTDDRQMALFYLGKMTELQGNPILASKYYHQFIASNPSNSDITYWVNARLAHLDPKPTQLVLNISQMPASVVRKIPGSHPTLQLSNEKLWQTQGEKLVALKWSYPSNLQVLEINEKTLWAFNNETQSLEEIQTPSLQVRYSIPHDIPLLASFHLESGDWFTMTKKHLRFLRNGRTLWTVPNRYPDCFPVAESFTARQILLNCPDNAIHPLDLKTGAEGESISLLERIDTVLSSPDGLWISNATALWHFKPQRSRQPMWQHSFSSIQSILLLGSRIILQEGDGSLNVFDALTGTLISRNRLEPGHLFAAKHRIGLLTKDGNLQLLDLDGQVLWRYQAGSPPACSPILTDSTIILPLENNRMVLLNARYFGSPQSDLQIRTERLDRQAVEGKWDSLKMLVDTILRLEPGNARAWMHKARYYTEKKSKSDSSLNAWSRAARHSRSLNSSAQQQILNPYARRLGALWIQYLPPSTQTYPKLFGDSRTLFTIDAGNRSLVALDPTSGQFRWRATTQTLDPSYITMNDGRLLAIASGYEVSIYDLIQKGRLIGTLTLPGKVFQINMNRSAIFVSTMNGFILRFQKRNLEPIWSRKVFTSGSYLATNEGILYSISQEGEINALTTESGTSHGKTQSSIVPNQMLSSDSSLIVISQDGQIGTFDLRTLQPLWIKPFGTQIFSSQLLPASFGGQKLLLGLSDQRVILLDLHSHKELWSIQGQGSVYVQPEVQGNLAFIDQTASILAVDLQEGRIIREYMLPDGAGPIWTSPAAVYSSSPQGLLFAYPIPR